MQRIATDLLISWLSRCICMFVSYFNSLFFKAIFKRNYRSFRSLIQSLLNVKHVHRWREKERDREREKRPLWSKGRFNKQTEIATTTGTTNTGVVWIARQGENVCTMCESFQTHGCVRWGFTFILQLHCKPELCGPHWLHPWREGREHSRTLACERMLASSATHRSDGGVRERERYREQQQKAKKQRKIGT